MNYLSAFVKLRRAALNITNSIIRKLFLGNNKYFYGKFYGTDSKIVLFIKNILMPSRFLKRLSYGQAVKLSPIYHLGTRLPERIENTDKLEKTYRELDKEGIVILPGFFEAEAESLRKRYRLCPENYPNENKYFRFGVELKDSDVLGIVTNKFLICLLGKYYDCQPYLRHLPGMNCTNPSKLTEDSTGGYNKYWHYDTPNLMTAHILLNDITEKDTCMLFATRNHVTFRSNLCDEDYFYSEEYVRDHFKLVKCIGPAGTLVVFNPNGLHRVELRENSFRSHLHINYVPGNDLIFDQSYQEAPTKSERRINIGSLTPIQRSSIKYFENLVST